MIQMSLHFDDADPVATCRTGDCQWHTHGDAINDAALAWTRHVTEEHREDWDDEPTGGAA